MTRTLPLLKQEREDTCAIACLRMVLAATGTMVTEAELVHRTPMCKSEMCRRRKVSVGLT